MAEAVWGELSARRTPTRDLGGGRQVCFLRGWVTQNRAPWLAGD